MNIKTYLISLIVFNLFSSIVKAQWVTQNSGTIEQLYGVSFIDYNNIIVVGSTGTILTSTDRGITWKAQSSGITHTLSSVALINQNIWIVAGGLSNESLILKTTDSGITWTSQVLPYEYFLEDINFSDSAHGTVVGGYWDKGIILRTTDCGDTWIPQVTTSDYLVAVSFTDSNNGIAVGGKTFFRTTNGGDSWLIQLTGISNNLIDVFFIDSSNAIAVGENGTILKTTDGGTNWIFQESGTTRTLLNIKFLDTNIGTIVGRGIILRTTDGGVSWVSQITFPSYYWLFGIDFINADIGVAVGELGAILLTQNGGVPVELISFSALAFSYQVYLNWVTATEINNFGFEIERSSNKIDWILIGFKNGNSTTTEINDYSFVDELLGTNSQKLYYRLKQIDFDGDFEYSNIIEVDIAPSEFALFQNYPNPFNPTTTIEYTIPQMNKLGFVTLKILDILGIEIATIINEEKQPGEYEIEFDASHLSSGIYFYRLQTVDGIITKKMILLK